MRQRTRAEIVQLMEATLAALRALSIRVYLSTEDLASPFDEAARVYRANCRADGSGSYGHDHR